MTATKNVSRNCSIGKHNRCLGTVIMFPPVDGERITECQCSAEECPHVLRAALASDEFRTPEQEAAAAAKP